MKYSKYCETSYAMGCSKILSPWFIMAEKLYDADYLRYYECSADNSICLNGLRNKIPEAEIYIGVNVGLNMNDIHFSVVLSYSLPDRALIKRFAMFNINGGVDTFGMLIDSIIPAIPRMSASFLANNVGGTKKYSCFKEKWRIASHEL